MNITKQNNFNRPWTTDEMKENAENWSLAGDLALLNTIKSFSEKLLSKTGEISDKIDSLLTNIGEAGLKFDLAQNEFQNLKNTQFIESRVYDDDESLDSKADKMLIDAPVPEDEQEKRIIDSVKRGMEILNEYYDELEVSVSDSEEDIEKSNSCEYILKPKDMYADRPLPPIIGTEEWYQKWHLDITLSDSDSDRVDIYSESDSEDNGPKHLIKSSESSSELDFSTHSDKIPVANSTVNNTAVHADLETSSTENECNGYLDAKTPLSNKSFAEQLAAKLGNIISEQEIGPEEVNKRPIQPATINIPGVPYNDEPPPLEHSILPKNIQSGYFSGGQGLFDDNDEDELFWGHPNKSSDITGKDCIEDLPKVIKSKGLFDQSSSDDEMFTTDKKQSNNEYLKYNKPFVQLYDDEPPELNESHLTSKSIKMKSDDLNESNIIGEHDLNKTTSKMMHQEKSSKSKLRNLFDEDEVDDFQTFEKSNTFSIGSKKAIHQKEMNLFDDDDDDTVTIDNFFSPANKVTPVTFSENDNINSKDASQKTSKSSHLDNASSNFLSKKMDIFDDIESSIINKPKTVSLFDDDDEIFNDTDFFCNVSTTKLKSTLFEEIEEKTDDLFNINYPQKISEKESSKATMHSTYEKSNKKEVTDSTKVTIVSQASRFLDEISELDTNEAGRNQEVKNVKNILFESDQNDPVVNTEKNNESNSTQNQMEPPPSEIENEYSTGVQVVLHEESFCTNHRHVGSVVPTETLVNPIMNLFDSLPPPDDCNDWDVKSDSPSDQEDYIPYHHENENFSRSSIFDNEPPSLGPNESSEIARNCSGTNIFDNEPPSLGPNESSEIARNCIGTKTETDVSPDLHASSSQILSSKIFGDQKSQDIIFIPKGTMEFSNPSNLGGLDSIPGISSSGNMKSINFSKGTKSSEVASTPNLEKEGNMKTFSFNKNQQIPSTNVESENTISRIATIKQNLQTENSTKTPNALKSSPGKLNVNFNINVHALRPGLGPPNLKFMSKSHSLELPNEEMERSKSETANNSSFTDIMTSTEQNTRIIDDNNGKFEVLQSITKDRVKIPVKRRPSTRKGRHEAIRRSAAELPFAYENVNDYNKSNQTRESLTKRCVSVEDGSTIKSITNENMSDILNLDQNIDNPALSLLKDEPVEICSDKIISKEADSSVDETNSSQKNIFTSENPIKRDESPEKLEDSSLLIYDNFENKQSEINLFGQSIIPENHMTDKIKTINLFDDDTSTDENVVYNSKITKQIPVETMKVQNITQASLANKNTNKKNIFSESDDDDDLFLSKPKKVSTNKTSLFDSGDESDRELFQKSKIIISDTEQKNSSSKSIFSESHERIKKPLFNDSSSDDDLFSNNGNKGKQKGHVKDSTIKSQKVSCFKKSENKETAEDPLSNLM